MNLGIRGHDLGRFATPADLARALKAAGLNSLQLVAWKALDGVNRNPGLWTEDLTTSIKHDIVDAGITIPLVGAYHNWYKDSKGIGAAIFTESLAAAKSMGAQAVGSELEGYTVLPLWNSPKNLQSQAMDLAVEKVRTFQAAADNAEVHIGIEGVWFHVLNTPEKVAELKERSGCSRIRFIFDPVNFLTPRNWRRQRDVVDRALTLYGNDLCLVHVKDFVPTPVGLLPVIPGKGRFDFPYLIRRLSEENRGNVPLILEGVPGSAVAESVDSILNLTG